jgi:hypothetical protein
VVNAADLRRTRCALTEQSLGWALHTLEPDEEIEIVRHLPRCPACRGTVADTEALLVGLATGVQQVEPPPGLRERILDAALETPQDRPSRPSRVEPPPAGTTPPRTEPVRHRSARAAWLRTPGRKLAAAAAALAVVVGIGGGDSYVAELRADRDARAVHAQSIVDMSPGSTGRGPRMPSSARWEAAVRSPR